ncbi:MAG: DHHA1 domain-containing protein [Paraclostridium sp.]
MNDPDNFNLRAHLEPIELNLNKFKAMIAIYHSKDLDGIACGAIIKKKYPDAELIGFDYGQEFPFDRVDGQDVIMADISLPMKDMKRTGEMAKSFIWIDHHVSAINDYNTSKCLLKGIGLTPVLNIGEAACSLTWKHLFGENVPKSIQLLSDYDVWNNGDKDYWEEEVLPFQYGVRSFGFCVNSNWDFLFGNDEGFMSTVISTGRIILNYERVQNREACYRAFCAEFEGYRAICLNAVGNSTMFDSVWDEDKFDLMILFSYNGDKYTFTLFTTKDIDCSELAKKYGGGGHKKAAGFRSDKLFFSDIKGLDKI